MASPQRFGTMQEGRAAPATPDDSGLREAQPPPVAQHDPRYTKTIPAPRTPTKLADWDRAMLATCTREELRALFTQRAGEWTSLGWRSLIGLSDDQLAGIPNGYFVATKPLFNPEPEEVADSMRLPRAIAKRYDLNEALPDRQATVTGQLQASKARLRTARLMRALFWAVMLLSLVVTAIILNRIGWIHLG